MAERRCWFVSGRVQGVWFRECTRREAERLGGLTGWVKNLPDGRVQVLAEGATDRLDALRLFLGEGPDLAAVERVMEASPPTTAGLEGFRVTG
ncbi:MAG: acylphosphatase [Deltaproteobacteria bacterium]|nr:acylphosphatase [Deltaproteobacteria bacterium]